MNSNRYGQKVKWLDTTMDSGITLVNPGVERHGMLLGVQAMQPQGQPGLVLLVFVRRLPDDMIVVMEASAIQFED
jgi:hypothetical protein